MKRIHESKVLVLGERSHLLRQLLMPVPLFLRMPAMLELGASASVATATLWLARMDLDAPTRFFLDG